MAASTCGLSRSHGHGGGGSIKARHVAIVGSGSLARSVCLSLAALVPDAGAAGQAPLRVTVLARDGAAAGQIARACRARAAVSGVPVTFAAEAAPTDEPADEPAVTLARLRPDLLVCCASAQSPYERITAPSAWTALIERAGFGLTLPLQATLAARLARAIVRASPDTLLINGCFPDVVNPLLAALGLPVHCGIGNVATLAACLQASLDLPDQRELAVLGHHAQLAAPDDPADEVRAWHGGTPLPGVTELLGPDRALPRRMLNALAGHAAARLLVDLASGAVVHTSLPGPLGLPGGYPVRLLGGRVALNLPAGLTTGAAIDWNLRVGRRDGVEIRDGRIGYPDGAAAALAAYLPEVAAGWPADALDEVADRLTALRQRLRPAQPAAVGTAC
ncbi:MAG TPA: potassium transporter TrkA [Pilimelia sp.]|nr:potassium transporter TrkA [Pilimelia sp.]